MKNSVKLSKSEMKKVKGGGALNCSQTGQPCKKTADCCTNTPLHCDLGICVNGK